MKKLFFISSSGSMATQWLSQLLSAGSKIKCFHGLVGLQPQHDANRDSLSALSLAKQWGDANSVEYVGMNHLSGNHGVQGLGACNSLGAQFCALVRDPIVVTDSQNQEKLKLGNTTATKQEETFQKIRSIPEIAAIVNLNERSDIVFFQCAESAIGHLLEIEVSNIETFKFEDYTVAYSEIRRLISFITNGQITDDDNIATAFETLGKKNTHRKRSIGVEDTWKSQWSAKQRQIFIRLWRYILGDYPKGTVNYPVAESLIQAG